MYLSHDIDFCLEVALKTGRVEATAGYTSTYIFLPTSELREVRHHAGGAKLRQLCDLDHEVALRFDIATSGHVMSFADEHIDIATGDGVFRVTSSATDADINTKVLINSIRLRLS